MDWSTAKERAVEIMIEQAYVQSALGLMGWDLWGALPPEGRAFRGRASAHLAKLAHEQITGAEALRLRDQIKPRLEEDCFENEYERAGLRRFVKKVDEQTVLPIELQNELREVIQTGQMVWREALKAADFQMQLPYMERLFELEKRVAICKNPDQPVFETLTQEVDEGISVETIQRLFAQLQEGLAPLLRQVASRDEGVDESVLDFTAPKADMEAFARYVVERVGFDFSKGSMGEVLHPMCYGIGPKDVRITTNYAKGPIEAAMSLLHESGHGMYNYSSNEQALRYGLWGGVHGSMHESQSRYIENILGRSEAFWRFLYPQAQRRFDGLRGVSFERFYRAFSKVKIGVKRLEADELSYSLHPILRFEIEKAYFDGQLQVKDFEEVWNEKHRQLFGLTPKNAAEGILQDIHWTSGHIGYFHSYTLGNLIGGQILEAQLAQTPDFYAQVERGEFGEIIEYLKDNIWQYGQLYNAGQLVERVTGKELSAQPFLRYLTNKYVR